MNTLLKIATRAWKKNISEIGEKGRDILRSKGILDSAREAKGLDVGSANIIKRYGGKVTSMSVDELGEHARDVFGKDPAFKLLNDKGVLSTRNMVSQVRMTVGASAGHVSIPYGKQPIVNRGNKIPDLLPIKDPANQQFANSLIHRHEADELRYGQQALRTNRKSFPIGDGRLVATTFAQTGHLSPKVIMREQQNMAGAPEEVNKVFSNARTGEKANIYVNKHKNVVDHSGLFDKALESKYTTGRYIKTEARNVENHYIQQNKENLALLNEELK